MSWTYDPLRRRYVDDAGHVLTQADLIVIRDALAVAFEETAATLAEQFTAGELGAAGFEAAFRELIGNSVRAQYLLGAGGLEAAAGLDPAVVNGLIETQWGYFDGFLNDLVQGLLSDAQAKARAALYGAASVQAYDLGRQETLSGFEFPCLPADGGTECGVYCRCQWDLQEFDDRFEARWITETDGNVCPGCQARGDQYALYVWIKGQGPA